MGPPRSTTTGRRIEAAGLRVETMRDNRGYRFLSGSARGATESYGIRSISVIAVKPFPRSEGQPLPGPFREAVLDDLSAPAVAQCLRDGVERGVLAERSPTPATSERRAHQFKRTLDKHPSAAQVFKRPLEQGG